MTRVITYGTYDLLHYGHIRLLKRAKALGDYLIVGVTADDFDKKRGKINVQQSLMERVEAVKATGIADEIIIEEYEGQKIDDIRRYNIDIFTVGSDWVGKFDYLREYCKVVYLDRTEGVSSSEIRTEKHTLRLGLVGDNEVVKKYWRESRYVNGAEIEDIYTLDASLRDDMKQKGLYATDKFENLLCKTDALYIDSHPTKHYGQIKTALQSGKHVLCESPIALSEKQCNELFELAREKNLVLMEAIKTAYSTAYYRLLLLAKSGKIGRIVSVDATCTSLRIDPADEIQLMHRWNSICEWGTTAMLPIFQLLGTDYTDKSIVSCFADAAQQFDVFTKIDFTYPSAVASLKVGQAVKSEGELVVSGTKGYIYVPAPWWKTDYFEIRYENPEDNRRYFYQLDGEGIRYEIVSFLKSIETGRLNTYIKQSESAAMASVIEDFMLGNCVKKISMPEISDE